MTPAHPTENYGSWDSIHVFEASERGRQAHYKLTSTIMLNMVNNTEKKPGEDGKKISGDIGLSGSMTRQVSLNLIGLDSIMGLSGGVAVQLPSQCPILWVYPLVW